MARFSLARRAPKKRRKARPAKRRAVTTRRRRRSRGFTMPFAIGGSPGRVAPVRRKRSRGRFRKAASRYGKRARRRFSMTTRGFSPMAFTRDTLFPSAIGAGGALALDLAWGYLPIPASISTGPLAPVARLAGAVGIGLAVGMVGGRKMGEQAMAGALTVTMYDLAKAGLQGNFPSLPLS